MHINGIPLHPLVVHAAVVLTPLAALAALGFALVPRWRWLLRWPTAVLAVLGAATVQLASMTGDSLKSELGMNTQLIHDHETWAGRLQVGMWVLAVVAVLAWWAMPYATRVVGGTDREARVGALVVPLQVLLALLAVAVVVLVVLTGDAGARAVWSR